MGAIASQITGLAIVYSTVYSDADKKTSKLRVAGLCAGNSSVTGEFPAQMTSNTENIPIWWRHHEKEGEGADMIDDGSLGIKMFSWISTDNDPIYVIYSFRMNWCARKMVSLSLQLVSN